MCGSYYTQPHVTINYWCCSRTRKAALHRRRCPKNACLLLIADGDEMSAVAARLPWIHLCRPLINTNTPRSGLMQHLFRERSRYLGEKKNERYINKNLQWKSYTIVMSKIGTKNSLRSNVSNAYNFWMIFVTLIRIWQIARNWVADNSNLKRI